jgi:hypothetical protein
VTITSDFWATTAQIIPALLLAIVVQERSGNGDGKPRERPDVLAAWSRLIYMATIGLGVLGEFVALNGLLTGGGRGTARLTVLAIGLLSFLAIGMAVMRINSRPLPGEDKPDDERSGAELLHSLLVSTVGLAAAFSPLIASIWLAARI